MTLPPELLPIEIEVSEDPDASAPVLSGIAADDAAIETIQTQIEVEAAWSVAEREAILQDMQRQADESRHAIDAVHRAEVEAAQYIHADAGDPATIGDGPAASDHAG